MSTQRAVTNRLLYQASLMAELAGTDTRMAMQQAACEAQTLFQNQALCSAVLEVCEHYQVRAQPQTMNLTSLLETLGHSHPDCWEYRTLNEAIREPTHWVSRLLRLNRQSVLKAPEKPGRAPASGQLISVVNDDDLTTNLYPDFQADLQQWIDDMRSLNDQH